MGQFKGDDLAGFWLKAIVSAGVPSAARAYNVSSITDTGVGILTVNINTPFASVHWSCQATVELTGTTYAVANARRPNVRFGSQTASAVAIDCTDNTATTNLAADPQSWHVAGFGDQ